MRPAQLLDSQVDIPQNWLADGSVDFISASRMFQPKNETPAPGQVRTPEYSLPLIRKVLTAKDVSQEVRRAFTFDTLRTSFSDTDTDTRGDDKRRKKAGGQRVVRKKPSDDPSSTIGPRSTSRRSSRDVEEQALSRQAVAVE